MVEALSVVAIIIGTGVSMRLSGTGMLSRLGKQGFYTDKKTPR